MTAPIYSRYVAIGDSSTEGIDDAIAPGRYRGWADRLAAHVAHARAVALPDAEPLLYANLAIRGRKTRQILDEQLAPAVAMRPDLASVFGGTNDIIRANFELEPVVEDIRTMQRALRAVGATVVTITMPDLSEVMPFARRAAPRLRALNGAVREVSRETGTIVVDLAAHPFVTDPRFWSADRLHANGEGHTRIAAAIAHALELPDVDETWALPLPPRTPPSTLQRTAMELRWTRDYFIPWAWRHARGHSSGDGITAKRPKLTPVHLNEGLS